MRAGVKSFLRIFAILLAFAVALAELPTTFDIDRNKDSEFCVFHDGREVAREGSGDCVLNSAAVAGRYLRYFAFFGGPFIGPLGLYLALRALEATRRNGA